MYGNKEILFISKLIFNKYLHLGSYSVKNETRSLEVEI